MVEDDTFTYHVKQQSRDQANTAAHSLITKERMQKLDLLIHLLSNLPQALVVCGPEGIGKTTLLKVLLERKTESWRYCPIQGNAYLSFEAIQDQLAKTYGQSLSMAGGRHEGQHKQLILIVDNAGELVPGLIAALIQYAEANPVLRVIFALTHDELQMKRGSDRVIDDCHIVEIPPLSEKQCGDFLQHLSTKPYANLSFKAISENMIAHIYRETHGVPGRIIAEVSGFTGPKPNGKSKWILTLAVAAACAIAIGVVWLLSSKNNDKGVTKPASVERQTGNIETVPPRPESQVTPPLPADQTAIQPQKQLLETDEAKDTQEPSVEADTHKDAQPPVISATNPGTISAGVKQPPENAEVKTQPEPVAAQQPAVAVQKIAEPFEVSSEKTKQSELNKANGVEPSIFGKSAIKSQSGSVSAVAVDTKQDNKQSAGVQQNIAEPPVAAARQENPKSTEPSKPFNNATPPVAEKLAVKIQPAAVSAVGLGQKPDNKQLAAAQQKTAESLWAKQEKVKQTELSQTANSIERATANNLKTIQIPQKPVEIAAVLKGPVVETMVPQQVESEAALVQPANNFTLQLMVLSKQSSINDMLKKYPVLEPNFKTIKVLAKGKEKFILVYGSYPDMASANKAKQFLPFEFRNALVRKISSIEH